MKRSYFLLFSALLASGIFLSACAPESNTITVATDANWEPFEFLDPTTFHIVGFDIDLMNAVAEAAGLQIEYFDVRWTPLLDGMAECQYDAAISSMTVTEERQQLFLFSDPYLAAGQIVVVQASNTDILGRDTLSGKVVGAQLDTTGEEQARLISGAEVTTYDDIGLAFEDLTNNVLDAVIADSPLALTYVGQDPELFKTVGDVFTDEVYAIAVCKTNPALLERINRGLATVKAEGLVDELIQTWMFKK
jgi:polar amino acid transport system substrate-binding protein